MVVMETEVVTGGMFQGGGFIQLVSDIHPVSLLQVVTLRPSHMSSPGASTVKLI